MPEHNNRQHEVGEESRFQAPERQHRIGHEEHRRQRSDCSFLAPTPFAADIAKHPVDRQANDRDERFAAEQHTHGGRHTFTAVKSQEWAPAVPHDGSDSEDPQNGRGRFSTPQQQQGDVTFSNVAQKGRCRPPLARHAADISKARILRADFGDIDSRSQHRDLREGDGTDQEAGKDFPDHNHFTL